MTVSIIKTASKNISHGNGKEKPAVTERTKKNNTFIHTCYGTLLYYLLIDKEVDILFGLCAYL